MKALAILSTLLNNYDCAITLYAIEYMGAREVNPLMDKLLAFGPYAFVGVKNLILWTALTTLFIYYSRQVVLRTASQRADTYIFITLLLACMWNTGVFIYAGLA